MGQRRDRTRVGRRAATIAALAALGISACAGDRDEPATLSGNATANTDAPAAVDDPAERAVGADGGSDVDAGAEPAVAPAGTAPATGGSAPTGLPFDETFGRDLIIEMGLTMSTSDVQATVDDVRRLTRANGGAVFRADVNVGEQLDDGSVTGGGTLVIRIPPELLDGLIDDLSGVARISNVRQDTQDVTDQLIDLDIRIRQARTGIAQIEVLYGQATEFEDLVEIERELARRQVELEHLLAAERGVEGRVALSTLTVQIAYEPPAAGDDPVADDAGDDGIGDAFRSGWDAFAGALFAVGFVLAVSAPFLVLAAAVGAIVWLATRRREVRLFPASAPAPGPAAPPEPVTSDDELVGASHED